MQAKWNKQKHKTSAVQFKQHTKVSNQQQQAKQPTNDGRRVLQYTQVDMNATNAILSGLEQ